MAVARLRRADGNGDTLVARLRASKRANTLFAVGILLLHAIFLFFRDPLDNFVDDMILALAYVVMALGLTIVVGFAGLLDLC